MKSTPRWKPKRRQIQNSLCLDSTAVCPPRPQSPSPKLILGVSFGKGRKKKPFKICVFTSRISQSLGTLRLEWLISQAKLSPQRLFTNKSMQMLKTCWQAGCAGLLFYPEKLHGFSPWLARFLPSQPQCIVCWRGGGGRDGESLSDGNLEAQGFQGKRMNQAGRCMFCVHFFL